MLVPRIAPILFPVKGLPFFIPFFDQLLSLLRAEIRRNVKRWWHSLWRRHVAHGMWILVPIDLYSTRIARDLHLSDHFSTGAADHDVISFAGLHQDRRVVTEFVRAPLRLLKNVS